MRALSRNLVNASRWLCIGLWSVLCISTALLVVFVARDRERALQMARTWWAPGVLRFGGARLGSVSGPGEALAGPFLFASNHLSLVDIPALFAALPTAPRFLAKKELRRVPFMGSYMAAVGMILVDRRRRFHGTLGTEQAAEVLLEGGSILVFPEGTRSADGEMQPFESGAFAAAIRAGAPVVPVVVTGTREILPKGSPLLRPGTFHVTLGSPIPTTRLRQGDRRALATRVEEAVANLQEHATQGASLELPEGSAPVRAQGAATS
jgi:1-acyl-sn-glycerol-3-phosphate acyltransferase